MGQIKVTKCPIEGLYIIEPAVHGDERGYFMETYNQNDMHEAGLDMVFVQDNQSSSVKGVLRGLHFQINHPQSKEMFDEWKPGEFDLKDDKMIKVTIAYYEKPNPKVLNNNIITGSEINRMGKSRPLLIFGVYLNDYPFTEDSWTLLQNNL